MSVDVFISHASEDKDSVAKPLAEALANQGLTVWLDEFELKIGDSLRKKIDEGLSTARYGVVILSPSFFQKAWTKRELDGLFARESEEGEKIILPVWHNLSAKDVSQYSPLLADRLAVSTDQGLAAVAKAITEAILIKVQSENQTTSIHLEGIIARLESLERKQAGQKTDFVEKELSQQNIPDEVFIVHGHDMAARESVCRFLEKIGVTPIVLAEQASLGQTIIEKLEYYSECKFAIVLLTPDDIGGVSSSSTDLQFRARQNVILELGYFLGKLGRRRFCTLNKGALELPSDLYGIVWIEMDPSGGWKISLARELRQAGIRIDLNRVLS